MLDVVYFCVIRELRERRQVDDAGVRDLIRLALGALNPCQPIHSMYSIGLSRHGVSLFPKNQGTVGVYVRSTYVPNMCYDPVIPCFFLD